jgi:hypothetical protein
MIKKHKKAIFGSAIVSVLLLSGFYVGTLNLQHSHEIDLKVSYEANNTDQLADDSDVILVGTATQNSKILTYEGVDFVATEVKVDNLIKSNADIGETITLLQTVAPEDPTIEKDRKTLLFLDQYEGPITSNAYVTKGLFQGQYKIKDNQVIVSDEIKEKKQNLADDIKSKKNLVDHLKNKYSKK